jgi:ATP-dependent DNA helicase RecQ
MERDTAAYRSGDAKEAVDPVAAEAKRVFDIDYLYPWQRLVIANILDAAQAGLDRADHPDSDFAAPDHPDRNLADRATALPNPGSPCDELHDEDGALRGQQIVLLPTGAGKSLCFQIPALFLDKPTLAVYPLLALQGDQLRRLTAAGLAPAYFRGGQSTDERTAQFARLEGTDGNPPARMIIANPEVLAGEQVLSRIAARGIGHLAIDEAHCVSEWGDSFRPAYLELGAIAKRLGAPVTTAFTATASPEVLSRIAEVLFSGKAHLVRGESDRPNITYRVHPCRARDPALLALVARAARPAIVFCSTRGGSERAARLLRDTFDDEDIRFYHAGLQKEEKIEVESWFYAHPRAILCCTCAFGMGVDKRDVRTVIHRNVPPSAEAYIQEAGRGGRDGESAEAILLWSPEDARRIARLPERERLRARELVAFAESGRCRREVLLEALGDPRAGNRAGGGEAIACSGCDVCAGTAGERLTDLALVERFVRLNRRAYTREEALGRLFHAGNRDSRERYGFSMWKRADFAEIVGELEKSGRIAECSGWIWKGKLTITRSSIRSLPRKRPRGSRRPVSAFSGEPDGEAFSGTKRRT